MRVIDHRLYKRKARLYYRRSISNDLKPFLPFKEIVLSLGTSDNAQGRLYVAKLDIEVAGLFCRVYSALKANPSEEGVEAVKATVTGCLDDLRQAVGLSNIRKSPHWYSSALKAVNSAGRGQRCSSTISKISKEYLKECIVNRQQTLDHKKTTYELFISIIGDVSLEAVSRDDARKYKAILIKTPPNLLKKLKLKSYSQVNWNKLPEGKGQSYATINCRLTPLISLFDWAEKNELYEGKNPFKGLLIKEAKQYAVKRTPYSKEELNTLFSCPIYSGCLGQRMPKRLIQGACIFKDYTYWIPLIGLYSGMRLNEICQLERGDIQEVEGVLCFNINDSDTKRLKTISSKRLVPIHNQLIQMGFLEYVYSIEAGRIFSNLKIGPNGRYSYRFTRLYSRLLVKLGLKRQGLCFHSFRHTFIDELRNSGVERSITMALVGHGNMNDTHGGYGYGYNLKTLQENINKMKLKLTLKL